MKAKVMFVLGLLLCSYALAGSISAEPEDFEVLWLITLPRGIYFVGETVTFTLTAYASIDPTLKLPDQMATVTIRNESSVEVFSAWINTNVNGSASVQWESGLEASTGNYTVILKDLNGKTFTKNFMVLYNEETYWKTRVELLEKEIDKMYEHLNYLFAANKWLTRQIDYIKSNFIVMWLMVFMCLLVGLYCGMYLAANTPVQMKGMLGMPGKLMKLLGLAPGTPLYLQHEEVAQMDVPRDKFPPIYGHDFICEICKARGLAVKRMTKREFTDHMWAHDRIAMKRASVMSKLRAWKASREQVKAVPDPAPSFGTVEEYAQGEIREMAIRTLKTRLDKLKKQRRKGLISDEEATEELSRIRVEKDKLAAPRPTKAYKETSAQKHEKTRKLRAEIPISGILESPARTSTSKTTIDDLYDRLSNEKVK